MVERSLSNAFLKSSKVTSLRECKGSAPDRERRKGEEVAGLLIRETDITAVEAMAEVIIKEIDTREEVHPLGDLLIGTIAAR